MTEIQQRSSSELAKLRKHIEGLQEAPWIGLSRKWWPRYVFHCTDIRNVANILRSGQLLSRVQARQTESLRTDIAAPDIIALTNKKWQDYVRLYFRPRTPTQYRNEGFRAIKERKLDSHCPVPVYLLFDAFSVLARQDSLFTDGNLASNTIPQERIDELSDMPFRQIYHDSWFEEHERQNIVYRRNAEVLIPQRLTLTSVQQIICRSQAEYETLLNLLPSETRGRWVKKIGVLPSLALFFAKWTFVRQVELTDEQIIFRFNASSKEAGPFEARCNIYRLTETDILRYKWIDDEFRASKPLILNLQKLGDMRRYRVSLLLDGALAFKGQFVDERLPF